MRSSSLRLISAAPSAVQSCRERRRSTSAGRTVNWSGGEGRTATSTFWPFSRPWPATTVTKWERGLAAVYPVALRLGRRVSVKPLAREEYEQGDSPLLREVRRTGVAA